MLLSAPFVFTANVEAKTESWPMSQMDLANTGYTTSAGPQTSNVFWNFTAGGRVWSDIAVVDGLVLFSSHDNKTYAIDSASGNKIWEYTTEDRIYSSPAVADGVVYIGSDDGNIYALDAKTGNLKWKYTTGDEVQASAKIADGIVYIGSADNSFYALDAASGSVVWKYTTGGDVCATAAVANGVVYVGSFDYSVYALDAATGGKIWSFPTGSFVESTPTFANGVVYFGSFDNKTYAVDAVSGQQLWSVETGHDLCVQSSPAVANGLVIIGSSRAGTLNGAVIAYNGTDGSVVWEYATDGLVFGAPIVAGDVVYAGSSYMGPIPTELTPDFFANVLVGLRGTMYALDRTSGSLVWSYQTGGAMYSSPAVVDEVLYVGSMDSHVYAFGVAAKSGLDMSLIYAIAGIVAVLIVVVVVGLMLRRRKR